MSIENSNFFSKQPFLVAKGVSKTFSTIKALDKVDFNIYSGQIHGLLGENGSGKSTLVKILYGIYTPDEGEIYMDNKRVYITSPSVAIKNGIVLVSQTPILIDKFTIVENMLMSLKQYSLLTKSKTIYSFLTDFFNKIGLKIDPNTEVYKLSYTEKQFVEIFRAILLNAKILLLDEVTTFLPSSEKKKLYSLFKELVKTGRSIVLITHKISDALEICDYLTILRRGRVVLNTPCSGISIDYIRKNMFGETDYINSKIHVEPVSNKLVLKTENIWVKGGSGEYRVKGVSIYLRKGEVLGIAGVTGNGQIELLEAIYGLKKIEKGRVFIENTDVTNKDTGFIRKMGIGFIPDDPFKYGLSIENNIVENYALMETNSFLINWSLFEKNAREYIDKYNITTPDVYYPVKLLSGGNLMKVLISRELEYSSKILIACNLTRGLDEYTKYLVKKLIYEKTKNGLSVIFTSDDLDDVLEFSSRILVMNSGIVVGEFSANNVNRDEVEKLMVM